MSEKKMRQKILAELQAHKINPMNDVLFKFVLAKKNARASRLIF